jgi:hypothetical protein
MREQNTSVSKGFPALFHRLQDNSPSGHADGSEYILILFDQSIDNQPPSPYNEPVGACGAPQAKRCMCILP